MRRLTKIAAVTAVMALALTGCGKKDTQRTRPVAADKAACAAAGGDGPKIGVAYDVGGRGDQSFNDLAAAGLNKASEDLGATCKEAKADARRAGHRQRGASPHARRRGLQPDHRGRLRLLPDGRPRSPRSTRHQLRGRRRLRARGAHERHRPGLRRQQGSYLVGVAAGAQDQDQAGRLRRRRPGPVIDPFEAGYQAGVKAVNPKIKVEIKYLPDQTDAQGVREPGRWQDRRDGACTTTAPTSSSTPPASPGTVSSRPPRPGEASWAIGVDSDQYLTAPKDQQPHILTSALKRVDVAVYDYIKAFKDGTSSPASTTTT